MSDQIRNQAVASSSHSSYLKQKVKFRTLKCGIQNSSTFQQTL